MSPNSLLVVANRRTLAYTAEYGAVSCAGVGRSTVTSGK